MRALVLLAFGLVALSPGLAQAQNARIVLRWKEVTGAQAYEVQIAKDPAFAEVVLQTRTTTAGYRWEQLPSTTYWWRVRSFDGESRPSEWSAPRTIAVDSAIPTPLKPADGASVSCGSTVNFQLEPSVLVKEYILELSSSAEFGTVRSLRSSNPSFEVPELPAGVWWWRTRGVDLKSRTSGPGPVRSLAVRVAAPKLKQISDVPLGTTQVFLSWSEVSCATSYLVEATQDGRDKVSFPVTGLALVFRAGLAGEYRWRVAGLDERGTSGDFSQESSFRVRLPVPGGRGEKVTNAVDLWWGAVPSATAYRVEVQRLAEGGAQSVAAVTVPGTSWRSPNLPPGQYQWRVTSKDALGHSSAPSDFRGFVRSAGAPLQPIAWQVPHADLVVSPGAQVELSWSKVADGRAFEIELDGAPTALSLPSYRTPPLSEGAHVVRVRALGDGFRASEWSEPREIYAGVPPVVRLEAELAGEVVKVRLLDSHGRVVEGATPKLSVVSGSLTEVRFEGGSWQARWSPPAGGRDVLRVDERDFHGEERLEAPMDRLFSLAARVGVTFSGGATASPSFGLAFTSRLPMLGRRPGLELRVGGYHASTSLDVISGVVQEEAWFVPLTLAVGWHHHLGAFLLKGAIGPVMQLSWVMRGRTAGFWVLPGVEVIAAASYGLGPGRLELEIGYLYARLDTSGGSLNSGGAGGRVGYTLNL